MCVVKMYYRYSYYRLVNAIANAMYSLILKPLYYYIPVVSEKNIQFGIKYLKYF